MQGTLATASWRARARLAGPVRKYRRAILVGLAVGMPYGTIGLAKPLGEGLHRELGITPLEIGIAVCIALGGAAVGTMLAWPLVRRWGHRAVAVPLTLTLAGVLYVAPAVIEKAPHLDIAAWPGAETSAVGLWVISALTGLLTRAMPLAFGWVSLHPRDQRRGLQVCVVGGLQAGMFISLLPGALVGDVAWADSFQWLAGMCVVASIMLIAFMRRPETVVEERADGDAGHESSSRATLAVRMTFWQQGLLWGPDILVVFLIASKGVPHTSLIAIFLPVLVGVAALPLTFRFADAPLQARLLNAVPLALVWPLIILMQLFARGAAYVTGVSIAFLQLEGGTAVWTTIGPLQAVREQNSKNAQRNNDVARTVGAVTGILVHALAYTWWGVWGMIGAGVAYTIVFVYDALLRTHAQRRELAELAASLWKRAEPTRGGWVWGGASGLSLASAGLVGGFVPQVSADLGMGVGRVLLVQATAWGVLALMYHRSLNGGGGVPRRGTLVALGLGGSGCAALVYCATDARLVVLGLVGLTATVFVPASVQSAARRRTATDGGNLAALHAGIHFGQMVTITAVAFGAGLAGAQLGWRAPYLPIAALLALLTLLWAFGPVPDAERPRPRDLVKDEVHGVLSLHQTRWAQLGSGALQASFVAIYAPLAVLVSMRGDFSDPVLVVACLGTARLPAAAIPQLLKGRIERAHVAVARRAFGAAVAVGLGLVLVGLSEGWALFLGAYVTILAIEVFFGVGKLASKSRWDADAAEPVLSMATKRAEALGSLIATLLIAGWLGYHGWLAEHIRGPVVLSYGFHEIGAIGALGFVPLFALVTMRYSPRVKPRTGTHVVKGYGDLRLIVPDGRSDVVVARASRPDDTPGPKPTVKAYRLRPSEYLEIVRLDGYLFGEIWPHEVTTIVDERPSGSWLEAGSTAELHDASRQAQLTLRWMRKLGVGLARERGVLDLLDVMELRRAGFTRAVIGGPATVWKLTGTSVNERYNVVPQLRPRSGDGRPRARHPLPGVGPVAPPQCGQRGRHRRRKPIGGRGGHRAGSRT